MDVNGKIALVTGAAIGIGFEIVKELLKNEAQAVILSDINEENGKKAVETLQKDYVSEKIQFIKIDVTKQSDFENAFKQTINRFGRIDILVNNAGIMNDLNYELEIDINMTAVVRGTMLGLKYMGKNQMGNGGTILNISSQGALDIQHCFPIYSSTKAAILNLSRAFGHPFHYNSTSVSVIALCPGKTETALQAVNNLFDGCLEELKRNIAKQSIQMSSSVGRAAIHAIKNGKSGSVWVIDQNNLYIIKFTSWESMREIIITNI